MTEAMKRRAAEAALEHIESGMTVGLGTGSTAEPFVRALAERVRDGFRIKGVATSKRTEDLARHLGIPLTEIEGASEIDVTVDGADQIDRELRLIKGGGGALLREKIVAAASQKMVVVADETKLAEHLGSYPLPIEIVRFGVAATTEHIFWALKEAGVTPEWVRLRENPAERPAPFITDSGHLIIDCACGMIPDPETLSYGLAQIPGVVEHGLFIGLASVALIGRPDGVETVTPAWHRRRATKKRK